MRHLSSWIAGFLGHCWNPDEPATVTASCNSAQFCTYALPNESKWPRMATWQVLGECLSNWLRFGRMCPRGTAPRQGRRMHSDEISPPCQAPPEWLGSNARLEKARCTMYDGCIDLSPLCSANCSAHCSIAYSEHIAYSCIFKVSIWFNHFSHFSRCNFCNFVSFCHSIQAQRFIHEFAKFLTTFGGSGGLGALTRETDTTSWKATHGRKPTVGLSMIYYDIV